MTVGGTPERIGILKFVPTEVSLGNTSIAIKRVGTVDTVPGAWELVRNITAGSSPCAGIPANEGIVISRSRHEGAPLFAPPPTPRS